MVDQNPTRPALTSLAEDSRSGRNKPPAYPLPPDTRIVNEAGYLTSAGETLWRQAADANPDPELLIPILVEGDWMTPLEGEPGSAESIHPAYLRRSLTDGSVSLWNGFCCPLFTREVAEEVVHWQQAAIAA